VVVALQSPKRWTTTASCSTKPSRQNQLHDYLNISQPGAYFHNRPRAAVGRQARRSGKARGSRQGRRAVTGDGFYMFGTPVHAPVVGKHYKAPFMVVVYQNRSYSTGTLRYHKRLWREGQLRRESRYDGGYFDPPIDFAKEAEAAGAYGRT